MRLVLLLAAAVILIRDPTGKWASDPLRPWFEALKDSLTPATRIVSMRFVSAHFGAESGRYRASCQLKTSLQASQQLRRHFVAVKAFAFACPRVPNRIVPFDVPIFVPNETQLCSIGNAAKRPLFH